MVLLALYQIWSYLACTWYWRPTTLDIFGLSFLLDSHQISATRMMNICMCIYVCKLCVYVYLGVYQGTGR
jgi:hypothetical protein